MRIGVPTTSYPRFVGDPAGVFVRSLCLALVARGHRCEVIAPHDELAQELRDDGVSLTRVRYRAPGWPRTFYGAGAPDNLAAEPRAALGALTFPPLLARAVRSRGARWDAVLSHWALPSAIATWAALGRRAHIAVWHSADVHLALRIAGPGAWSLLRPLASHHVFVAAHLRDRLLARASAREARATSVIPMGVELPAATPLREPLGQRRLRALVLARLVPIKRVELAVEAVARVPDVELVIAGDGPSRAALEARAGDHRGRIRFVGTVDEIAKRELFAWADVLLATSGRGPGGSSEGYPVAPREALAHGVVVVATDDVVHRELAARTGQAVVLCAEEALAPTLAELARTPSGVVRLARLAAPSVAHDAWPAVALSFERILVAHARSVPEQPAAQGRSELEASGARVG